MPKDKKMWPLILVSLTVLTVTATAGLRGQGQGDKPPGKSSPALEKAKEDFYTLTDYEAPEPADPHKRELRRARARRHNLPAQKGVDPKLFMITEERDSGFGGPPSHTPEQPALPAAQSDLVVIGEVTDAEAFLSEDKVSILSAFTVRVAEVLKDRPASPVGYGDSVSAVRGGGAVRMPSGKIIRHGHSGKPLPRVGRRYALFLKSDGDAGQDFEILTAYELREGRVFPLDGIPLSGTVEPAYAAYQKYEAAAEADFIFDVRVAITRNLGEKPVWRWLLR